MRNKNIWLLLLVPFVLKCILALTTELGNDEVYYWTYAQKLQWSYFDHPPMIALLQRIFTANLLFHHQFFLRLGPIVCGAVSTILIYKIGKKLLDETAGFISALLFLASPYGCIIAGWMLLPDAPQLVFWLMSILLMLKINDAEASGQQKHRWLLLLGCTIGCCILSKVHGVFLLTGFLAYLLFFNRRILKDPCLYLSILITLLFAGCIFYWNYTNQFISYTYHSSRVSFFTSVHWEGFLREISGELLYNGPVNFVLIIAALFALRKNSSSTSMNALRVLYLVALPLIGVVLFISLFRDTLPHWSGPAYTTLIPVAGAWLRLRQRVLSNRVPAIVKYSLALLLVALLALVALIHWLPVNIGSRNSTDLGQGDPTLDMSGFEEFGRQFDSVYLADKVNGIMKNDAFLISDYWFPAAHLDYYVAQRNSIPFAAIGGLASIHHYAWLNNDRKFLQKGDDAYLVMVSNYANPPSPKLQEQFDRMLSPQLITQYRRGVPIRNFIIYRLKQYKGNIARNGILEN